MKIGIIDIDMGNLYSLEKALNYINQNFIISSDTKKLAKCDKFILPGVGAFNSAMQKIKTKGIDKFLNAELKKKKTFIGNLFGYAITRFKKF